MSLKQLSKESRDERENVPRDTLDCWHRERERTCFRVETRGNEVFIFPYSQFLGAHHIRAGSEQTLKIMLSNYEIILTGLRLEKLLVALQEFAVAWIKPVPARYRHFQNSETVITAIAVRVISE